LNPVNPNSIQQLGIQCITWGLIDNVHDCYGWLYMK
jgi:hypothetical protein